MRSPKLARFNPNSSSGLTPLSSTRFCFSSFSALAAGTRIPNAQKHPYWKDIRLPGGVKPEEWNGFHDLVLIEELHKPDFGGAMGLFAGGQYQRYVAG